MSAARAATEFGRVISCRLCQGTGGSKLLLDESFNLPQPGYVGRNYANTRVLLVGQNPGESRDRFAAQDQRYAAALNAVASEPTDARMVVLQEILDEIIPSWPVSGNYFPLSACDLTLADIAYLNLVRCRTLGNSVPAEVISRHCRDAHFWRWIDWLSPRVVVFIGKWAHDQVAAELDAKNVPYAFMNRMRSLSGTDRQANVAEVVAVVRGALGRILSTPAHTPRAALSREPESIVTAGPDVTDRGESDGRMNVAGYEAMFQKLGFSSFESRKKLQHPDLWITVYFNWKRSGFVWFAVRADQFDAFQPALWDVVPPPQKKDSDPSIRTVVPKAGFEEAAFRDLLKQ